MFSHIAQMGKRERPIIRIPERSPLDLVRVHVAPPPPPSPHPHWSPSPLVPIPLVLTLLEYHSHSLVILETKCLCGWVCGCVDGWMCGWVDVWMGDIKSISPSIYSLYLIPRPYRASHPQTLSCLSSPDLILPLIPRPYPASHPQTYPH